MKNENWFSALMQKHMRAKEMNPTEFAKWLGAPREAAAAIIVAMINRTDGFDIANADHRASVTDAIGEVMDSLTNAIGRSQPYDQYAE